MKEEEVSNGPGPGTEKTQKTTKIPIPTQKTFVFKGSSTAEEIDAVINPWMKIMALKNEMPHIGKVTTLKRLFSSKIIYVFMHSTFVEVPVK